MRRTTGLLLLVSACTVDLGVPTGAVAVCTVDAECPEGQRCAPRRGVCFPEELACAERATSCALGAGTGVCDDGLCIEAGCGNGLVEAGEVCDEGDRVAGDGCSADCLSLEICGNGIRDVDEGCDCGDGLDDLPVDCTQANSDDPDAECRTDCRLPQCGDGVRAGLEACDGADFGAATCRDLGFYEEAGLACSPLCLLDGTTCLGGRCGDDIVNGDESCDGSLGSSTCLDFGYYGADGLVCNAACRFDLAGCQVQGFCGDLTTNGDEACDGDTDGQTCASLGYYFEPGLVCNGACALDVSDCAGFCRDGTWQPAFEECEGDWQRSETCLDFGRDFGHLRCSNLCLPSTEDCGRFDWRAQVVPNSDALLDIWAASSDDVWAVGLGGVILRNRGSAWELLDSPTTANLSSIHGTSSDDVWAVGEQTTLHWDGAVWTVTTAGAGLLTDVLAFSGGAFALRYNGVSSASLVRRDGDAWTSLQTATSLVALWGSSADDVWAAGFMGTALHHTASGTASLSIGTATLYALWGSGRDDVWAGGAQGVLHHYDGVGWSEVVPGRSPLGPLTSISGRGPRDVWAVGNGRLLRHFDGEVWSDVASPPDQNLVAVSVTPTGNVWLIGDSAGRVFHLDDGLWTTLPSVSGYSVTSGFGLTAEGLAAGNGATVSRYSASNGWLSQLTMGDSVVGLWSFAPDDLWTAAYGELYRESGAGWSAVSVAPQSLDDAMLTAWGTSSADLWMIDGGGFLRRQGTTWSRPTDPPCQLYGLWGSGPDDIWAGGNGCLYRWNGLSWTEDLSVEVSRVLWSLWGFAADDIWAVGEGGTILHYDGAGWQVQPSPTGVDLRMVWGASPRDVFAVGRFGTLLHYDGEAWSFVRVPQSALGDLDSVWGRGRQVFVGGDGGWVGFLDRSRPFHCEASEFHCGDALDNDCDGALDADDADCLSAVRLVEVASTSVGFFEVANTTGETAALQGLSLSYRFACDGAVRTYTFPPEAFAPGLSRFRVIDDDTDVQTRERFLGATVCDTETGSGWAALCAGPCDLLNCANVIDYVAKDGAPAFPNSPACATFSAGPVDSTGATAGQSLSRVAFTGVGAVGQASDWVLAPASRD